MSVAEWTWSSRDGVQMYARAWMPAAQPKAVICLVHGHGEHINRYNHLGQAFAQAGYVAQGFDLRGHGQSGGPRGYTPSYESLMSDIADFLADARKRYSTLPVFLCGHSMGGNLVANFALRYPDKLNGVLLGSPWLRLAFEPPRAKLAIAKVLNFILPSLSQPSGLENAAISRDTEEVKKYEADPLVHDRISLRLFLAIQENAAWALENAAMLKLPTLLMHGSADRLSSAPASQEFAAKAGSLVTLRIWDGLYHELHNEPEKADVIQVMIDWIGAHQ